MPDNEGSIQLSAAELATIVTQARESARAQTAAHPAPPVPSTTFDPNAVAAQILEALGAGRAPAAPGPRQAEPRPEPYHHVPAPVSTIQPTPLTQREITTWSEAEFTEYARQNMPEPHKPMSAANRSFYAEINKRLIRALHDKRIVRSSSGLGIGLKR